MLNLRQRACKVHHVTFLIAQQLIAFAVNYLSNGTNTAHSSSSGKSISLNSTLVQRRVNVYAGGTYLETEKLQQKEKLVFIYLTAVVLVEHLAIGRIR